MSRNSRAAQNRAIEARMQQRLAARHESARRAAETRKHNQETQEMIAAIQYQEAELAREKAAASSKKSAGRQSSPAVKSPAPKASTKPVAAKTPLKSPVLVTITLRGKQAERLQALAQKKKLTPTKLVLVMLEKWEGKAEKVTKK
jgi:hypothetical protein